MEKYQAKDLFQLQTELINMKVDMAVTNTVDRVIEQISNLKHEIHTEIRDLKNEMSSRFSSLDNRVIAVETKLGMVNETEKEIRAKFDDTTRHVRNNFIDYAFRAGWLLLASILTFVLYHPLLL